MAKRWSERIDDLERAISRLAEAIEDSKKIELSTLRDGVIQRFEFTIELSWKALKFYLNSEGVEEATTPKSTIREAFRYKVIENIDIWIKMLDDRNQTSHMYSLSTAEVIYENIVREYFEELEKNYNYLKGKDICG